MAEVKEIKEVKEPKEVIDSTALTINLNFIASVKKGQDMHISSKGNHYVSLQVYLVIFILLALALKQRLKYMNSFNLLFRNHVNTF
jgi:hypothetical protein